MSFERCHCSTWCTFPVVPDDLFPTIQNELGLLPLLLPWTVYSIDVRLAFLDSWLLTFVCTMSKNANMHVLIDDVI